MIQTIKDLVSAKADTTVALAPDTCQTCRMGP